MGCRAAGPAHDAENVAPIGARKIRCGQLVSEDDARRANIPRRFLLLAQKHGCDRAGQAANIVGTAAKIFVRQRLERERKVLPALERGRRRAPLGCDQSANRARIVVAPPDLRYPFYDFTTPSPLLRAAAAAGL